jgi:hydrogenase expression/formation protein HypE
MKYVDEFRDPARIARTVADIRSLADSGKTCRRSLDGVIGGIMRSALPVRTSEANAAGQSEDAGMSPKPEFESQRTRLREAQIEMAHGAGGLASRRLIEALFVPCLAEGFQELLGDAADITVGRTRLAITTDSFVVHPLTFPGGSIGELAVNGTVNDLAVAGAKPEALVAGFVLEAGLPTSVLQAQIEAMANAARSAGVRIVGGDTKVVEHGKADGMYITTTAVGSPLPELTLDVRSVRPGDKILLSGFIGDHGVTILLVRGDLHMESEVCSDTRSVFSLVRALSVAAGEGVRWMRDPTRGGVATSLNELARDCGLGICLCEDALPVRDAVRGACELLGLDPLHIANEGQFLAVVAPEFAHNALEALRRTPGGEAACIIGEVREQLAGMVVVSTSFGGNRIVDMLAGDPLPRIC